MTLSGTWNHQLQHTSRETTNIALYTLRRVEWKSQTGRRHQCGSALVRLMHPQYTRTLQRLLTRHMLLRRAEDSRVLMNQTLVHTQDTQEAPQCACPQSLVYMCSKRFGVPNCTHACSDPAPNTAPTIWRHGPTFFAPVSRTTVNVSCSLRLGVSFDSCT
jgi:hypothetical protein